MAAPGAALKRLRQRFGIRAPKLAIRAHVPWYWRALSVVVLLSLSFAGAAWIYDAGRSIAGFDSRHAEESYSELNARVQVLEAELSTVRAVASAADSNLRIERVAQQQLALQVRALEAENLALKQDLAFFEGLVPGSGDEEQGIRINRFRVDPDALDGKFRYRMLLVHNAPRQQKEFRGTLQFAMQVRLDGKDAMIVHPSEADANDRRYHFEVRHFQRLEGVLVVPSGAVLKSVEVRILQEGGVRARQTINL